LATTVTPQTAFDVDEMNRRIAERARAAELEPALPIKGPPWAGRIIDRGHELVAIHRVTANPYPLDLFRDLTSEEIGVVLIRRILGAGGTSREAERLIDALTLPAYATRRLKRNLSTRR
jgi:hypothetical protein